MIIISILQRKNSDLSLVKSIILSVFLVFFGVLGTILLSYIENGTWGGISFYGSVFIIPLVLPVLSILFKERYAKLLDYSVPQICAMLCVMKINCFICGCCGGKFLYISQSGDNVYFPSQIIESIIALILTIVFIFITNKHSVQHYVYPLFFIVYGSARLILNFFRAISDTFVWIIPAGHFWSMLSIIIGFVFLINYFLRED